jgi:hypothetical protein
MAKASRLVLALVGALLISGCALRTVHVAQLKDQPARYYNKTVTVKGTVTRSWGVPLVPFQFYNVDDGHRSRSRSSATRVVCRPPGSRVGRERVACRNWRPLAVSRSACISTNRK